MCSPCAAPTCLRPGMPASRRCLSPHTCKPKLLVFCLLNMLPTRAVSYYNGLLWICSFFYEREKKNLIWKAAVILQDPESSQLTARYQKFYRVFNYRLWTSCGLCKNDVSHSLFKISIITRKKKKKATQPHRILRAKGHVKKGFTMSIST